jgi:hypothetical protein
MKMSQLVAFAVVSMMWCSVSLLGQTNGQARCEAIYQQWHIALAAHPAIGEPGYFRTDSAQARDLADAVRNIDSNQMAMAYFLCEKMATETNSGIYWYQDLHFLEYVAGINLWFADHPIDNIATEVATNLIIFKQEWLAGVYNDPSSKVAKLCEERLAKETSAKINPRDLAAIRRYGVFALPELIRQMKKHNSRHAFGACLIILQESNQFRDYLDHSDQQFATKDAKVAHVKEKFERMKLSGGAEKDVMKKISEELAK